MYISYIVCNCYYETEEVISFEGLSHRWGLENADFIPYKGDWVITKTYDTKLYLVKRLNLWSSEKSGVHFIAITPRSIET